MVDWFAMTQEISFRTIGLPFRNTIDGWLLSSSRKMNRNENRRRKTLASTLPVSLNALSKEGVHVVTVNDYLAEREKWGKVYRPEMLVLVKVVGRKTRKHSDITYVTNSEVVFDFYVIVRLII
jgi:preprotein translocase subunit SecA